MTGCAHWLSHVAPKQLLLAEHIKAQHFTLIQQGACVGALGWTCKVTNKIPCEGPYLRPPPTVIADYSILGSQEKGQ